MARAVYIPEDFGTEVSAPSGYYVPLQEEIIDHGGRRLLFVSGAACIEASCCGIGRWGYVRVEGYVVDEDRAGQGSENSCLAIETVEDDGERRAIGRLLQDRYPGARIEFR